jgi:YidC/Oxa1 family membrane protein insertase
MDKRIISWLLLSTCTLLVLLWMRARLLPPPAAKPVANVAEQKAPPIKADDTSKALTALAAALPLPIGWTIPTDLTIPQVLDAELAALAAFQGNQAMLAAADEDIVLGDPESAQILVVLSKRGAAVRRITLQRFEQADRKTAAPTGARLVLVTDDEDGDWHQLTPLQRLGRQSYRLLIDGRALQWEVRDRNPWQVVFEAVLPEKNVRIVKTFGLKPDQYHVDLDVRLEAIDPARPATIAYELTGPQGVPVEGEYWKSNPYRHVVIGAVDASNPYNLRRYLFDPNAVDPNRGNKAPPLLFSDPGNPQEMQYAGVMNQFFAALTVANFAKEDGAKARPIAQATPQYLGDEPVDQWTRKAYTGKVTVNLTSRPAKLDKKNAETHSYLLYAGPVKVILLGYEKAVRGGLADHYASSLHLNTLTDYPSDNWMASFFYAIGWTRLLIFCTNLMHGLLEWLHAVVPVYGITIILITFMVRMCMFPVSRKQAQTMQKMQKLQPELAKLQEKYKDDWQQLAQAQRELQRKHGVNPASGCLVVLLQMPIFMGLYYALNESIHLRLSSFLWVKNLAAPDMLINWEHWPVISSIASGLRLGPYFHLLPLISIVLIIVQQKLTMPPPANDQQKMQMKMMNGMMYLMAYTFYWVAAGLCVYFTVSGIWGMVERRFLPKKTAAAPDDAPAAQTKTKSGASPRGTAAARARDRVSTNGDQDGLLNKLANWWNDLLKKAEKR